MPKETIYQVTWRDPESNPKWLDKEELEEWMTKVSTKNFNTSIGYIVKETPKFTVICSDKNETDVGSCTLIFKSLIVKKEVISVINTKPQ